VRANLVDPTLETPAEHGLLLGRNWLHLAPDDATEFYDRLMVLLAEFKARQRDATDENALPYETIVGFYPVTNPPAIEPERNEHE
jgi:hypothetical protein